MLPSASFRRWTRSSMQRLSLRGWRWLRTLKSQPMSGDDEAASDPPSDAEPRRSTLRSSRGRKGVVCGVGLVLA